MCRQRLKSVEYREHIDVHRRFKSFEVGDEKMVHLRKEWSTYSKLNVQKIVPCQIKRKFCEHAYQVELPKMFDISHPFSMFQVCICMKQQKMIQLRMPR
jgi:hypothetical protein